MTAWRLRRPGGVDAFEQVTLPLPALAANWVLVEVDAFGLNRSELFSRRGMSSPDFSFPRVLGLECAGRIANGNDTDLESGQRVIALMGGMGRSFDGSYATHVAVPRKQVFCAPEGVPNETLGAVPETYNTAFGVCIENLGLRDGETVLVRGGTSALGRAASEIAKDLGCTVVGTSRSHLKAERLANVARFDEVLVDGEDLPSRVLEAVGPVDAAVDCVGSRASVESIAAAMPNGGRIGLVGQLSETWDSDRPPNLPVGVRSEFTRSDLVEAPQDDERMQTILARVADGRWGPNIDRVFPFGELPTAHEHMEQNRALGKIVVTVAG